MHINTEAAIEEIPRELDKLNMSMENIDHTLDTIEDRLDDSLTQAKVANLLAILALPDVFTSNVDQAYAKISVQKLLGLPGGRTTIDTKTV